MQLIYGISLIQTRSSHLPHRLSSSSHSRATFSLYFSLRHRDSGKNSSNICAIDGRVALAALAGSQLRTSNTNRQQPAANNQTHEMTVPNELIGCIIGKGGTKIAEIRQISGAMIRISNCEEREGGATDRTITITGNPDAVALAQYLINMRWVPRGLYRHFPSGPSDRRSAFGPTGSHSDRFVQGSAFGCVSPNSIFNRKQSNSSRLRFAVDRDAFPPFDLFYLFIYFFPPCISTGNARQIGARLAGVEWFLVGPYPRDPPIRLFVLLVLVTTCCLT